MSRNGHIPISFQDPDYIKELVRQEEKGFSSCLCSNCEPALAEEFMNAQHHATNSNFSDITLGTYSGSLSHDLCCPPPTSSDEADLRKILTCPSSDKARGMKIIKILVDNLVSEFNLLYDLQNPNNDQFIKRSTMFNIEKHAWPIAKNADIISQGVSLRGILGSEGLDGMFDCILRCILDWQNSDEYELHQADIVRLAKLRVAGATKKVVDNSQKKRTNKVAGLDAQQPTEATNLPNTEFQDSSTVPQRPVKRILPSTPLTPADFRPTIQNQITLPVGVIAQTPTPIINRNTHPPVFPTPISPDGFGSQSHCFESTMLSSNNIADYYSGTVDPTRFSPVTRSDWASRSPLSNLTNRRLRRSPVIQPLVLSQSNHEELNCNPRSTDPKTHDAHSSLNLSNPRSKGSQSDQLNQQYIPHRPPHSSNVNDVHFEPKRSDSQLIISQSVHQNQLSSSYPMQNSSRFQDAQSNFNFSNLQSIGCSSDQYSQQFFPNQMSQPSTSRDLHFQFDRSNPQLVLPRSIHQHRLSCSNPMQNSSRLEDVESHFDRSNSHFSGSQENRENHQFIPNRLPQSSPFDDIRIESNASIPQPITSRLVHQSQISHSNPMQESFQDGYTNFNINSNPMQQSVSHQFAHSNLPTRLHSSSTQHPQSNSNFCVLNNHNQFVLPYTSSSQSPGPSDCELELHWAG